MKKAKLAAYKKSKRMQYPRGERPDLIAKKPKSEFENMQHRVEKASQ